MLIVLKDDDRLLNAYEALSIGNVFCCEISIDETMIERFSDLSGDKHPLHTDSQYAISLGFDTKVAYGNILSMLLSRLIGREMNDYKVALVSQLIEFIKPVYAGNDILLVATVARKTSAVQAVQLNLSFQRQGEIVATGRCVVKCLG